jgi:hypothetical protein
MHSLNIFKKQSHQPWNDLISCNGHYCCELLFLQDGFQACFSTWANVAKFILRQPHVKFFMKGTLWAYKLEKPSFTKAQSNCKHSNSFCWEENN